MTTGGWINMLLSVGFVTALFVYCVVRVLKGPGSKREHELGRVEPIDRSKADER
jgi:hypothetical protein